MALLALLGIHYFNGFVGVFSKKKKKPSRPLPELLNPDSWNFASVETQRWGEKCGLYKAELSQNLPLAGEGDNQWD